MMMGPYDMFSILFETDIYDERVIPFLPQSWKWKITLNERKLTLEGPIFYFHDYGRKGNNEGAINGELGGCKKDVPKTTQRSKLKP